MIPPHSHPYHTSVPSIVLAYRLPSHRIVTLITCSYLLRASHDVYHPVAPSSHLTITPSTIQSYRGTVYPIVGPPINNIPSYRLPSRQTVYHPVTPSHHRHLIIQSTIPSHTVIPSYCLTFPSCRIPPCRLPCRHTPNHLAALSSHHAVSYRLPSLHTADDTALPSTTALARSLACSHVRCARTKRTWFSARLTLPACPAWTTPRPSRSWW